MAPRAPHPLQMVLDLFGRGAQPALPAASPPVPPAMPAETLAQAPAPAVSPAPDDMPADACDDGPAVPDALDAPDASDTLAAHPQANGRIELLGQPVAYLLIRAPRRSIGFLIDGDGLRVRAPRAARQADIEQALREKADWIVRKLREFGQRQQQRQSGRLVWQDGMQLPYLGQPLTVRLGPGPLAAPVLIVRRGRDRIGLRLQREAEGNGSAVLWVGLPAQAPGEALRELVAAWLQHQARALFEQRLAVYAPALAVRWTRLALTNARTRWGSATSTGHIRLNWRLVHFRLPVIDYVVAHELAHLRVMDHSPRFWQTVASVMPDYAARRQELRQGAVPEWA
ncbi:MAG: SprT family zinc-dependent metalloprotease [Comamonas sp.]